MHSSQPHKTAATPQPHQDLLAVLRRYVENSLFSKIPRPLDEAELDVLDKACREAATPWWDAARKAWMQPLWTKAIGQVRVRLESIAPTQSSSDSDIPGIRVATQRASKTMANSTATSPQSWPSTTSAQLLVDNLPWDYTSKASLASRSVSELRKTSPSIVAPAHLDSVTAPSERQAVAKGVQAGGVHSNEPSSTRPLNWLERDQQSKFSFESAAHFSFRTSSQPKAAKGYESQTDLTGTAPSHQEAAVLSAPSANALVKTLDVLPEVCQPKTVIKIVQHLHHTSAGILRQHASYVQPRQGALMNLQAPTSLFTKGKSSFGKHVRRHSIGEVLCVT